MHALPIRFLDARDVRAAGGLDVVAAMADLRAALALWRAGDADMPPEVSVPLGHGSPARAYALAARLGGAIGLAGVKWTAHRPQREDGAPPIVSVTVVTDALTGLPVGIVESAQLTATRTAAASALALLHGASAPVRKVTILGAGVQAAAHLRMLATVFPGLQEVTLWNRSTGRAQALIADVPTPWAVAAGNHIAAGHCRCRRRDHVHGRERADPRQGCSATGPNDPPDWLPRSDLRLDRRSRHRSR